MGTRRLKTRTICEFRGEACLLKGVLLGFPGKEDGEGVRLGVNELQGDRVRKRIRFADLERERGDGYGFEGVGAGRNMN